MNGTDSGWSRIGEWIRGVFVRPPKPKRSMQGANHEHIHVSNPWHAVSITAGKKCCGAAQNLRNVRFLATQAPTLPLEGCSLGHECKCVYRHFSDRRQGPRRSREKFPITTMNHIPAKPRNLERRSSRGRRATDG